MGLEKLKNLFNPKPQEIIGAQKRGEDISKEERKRLTEIATKIVEFYADNNVTIDEVPRITQLVLAILNKKLDNAEVEKVMKYL